MKRSLVIGAAAALVLPGAMTMRAQAQDAPEIVIASSTFDSATAGYYAYKTGMFKKAGLNVTFTALAPPGIPAAVASGAVQIASNNLFSLVEAKARNVPFVLIAPGASFDTTDEDGYAGLIVKKSSTMLTGKDFAGKTVGVNEVKGFNALAAMTWIDRTGGDSTKVTFVEIPAPAAAAAVSSGRIDATILTVPFLGAALALGDVSAKYHVIDKTFNSDTP